ncbi:MAG: DMT family protein, partial [Alistipes sp.]|nr:DMT family protein [Alistipes sp.]
MLKALSTIGLLLISNSFMTLAWYGQIAFRSRLEKLSIAAIILLSWGVALAEYAFMVP